MSTRLIKPSQVFLNKGTLDFILGCYKNGTIDFLPPTPLVRKMPDGENEYIAIDGHHLIAAHEFLGTEVEVYVVDSSKDYLPNPNRLPSISKRNQDLMEKFDRCVSEAQKTNSSFAAIIKDTPY